MTVKTQTLPGCNASQRADAWHWVPQRSSTAQTTSGWWLAGPRSQPGEKAEDVSWKMYYIVIYYIYSSLIIHLPLKCIYIYAVLWFGLFYHTYDFCYSFPYTFITFTFYLFYLLYSSFLHPLTPCSLSFPPPPNASTYSIPAFIT